MKKVLDIALGVLSLLSGALPLIDTSFRLLPVNPVIREDVLSGAILLAAAGGLGGYMTIRHYRRTPSLGWVGLMSLLVALSIVYLLASAGIDFGLSSAANAGVLRIAYLLVFLASGITVGGFCGLYRSSDKDQS